MQTAYLGNGARATLFAEGCGKIRRNFMKKQIAVITMILLMLTVLFGCGGQAGSSNEADQTGSQVSVQQDGEYTTKDEVAAYIHDYGELPDNFITKKEAKALGWKGGSLEPYAEGKSIGGDRFGNREGLLPEGDQYTECDINTKGADSRGAERIVYSDNGDIYYTEDHYKSFSQLDEGE